MLTFLLVLGTGMTWIQIAILVVVAILATMISAGIIGRRLAPVVKEFNEALDLYRKAKSKDSDGGRKITDEEAEKLREEALEVFVKAWDQYGDRVLGWFTRFVARVFR